MHHLDILEAYDTKNDVFLGTCAICVEPECETRYAYYARSPEGQYELIKALKDMSVQDCREYEKTRLEFDIRAFYDLLETDEWKIYRLRPTVWTDSSTLSPEVTNYNWLKSIDYCFED